MGLGLSDLITGAIGTGATITGYAVKLAPLAFGAAAVAQMGEDAGLWNVGGAVGDILQSGDDKVRNFLSGTADYLLGNSKDKDGKDLTADQKAAIAETNKIENYVDRAAFKAENKVDFDPTKFEAVSLADNGNIQFRLGTELLSAADLANKTPDQQKEAKMVVGYYQLDANGHHVPDPDPAKAGKDKIVYAELKVDEETLEANSSVWKKFKQVGENIGDGLTEGLSKLLGTDLTGKGAAGILVGGVAGLALLHKSGIKRYWDHGGRGGCSGLFQRR